MGLVAPRPVGSSRTRARTRVPCIGRRILNHCTTREVPPILLYSYSFINISWLPPQSTVCKEQFRKYFSYFSLPSCQKRDKLFACQTWFFFHVSTHTHMSKWWGWWGASCRSPYFWGCALGHWENYSGAHFPQCFLFFYTVYFSEMFSFPKN